MISQVVTYLPSKTAIFGIDHGGQSLVYSPDDGQTWTGISKDYYRVHTLGEVDAINATVVPWISIEGTFDDKTTGERCAEFSSGDWHGKFAARKRTLTNMSAALAWKTKRS